MSFTGTCFACIVVLIALPQAFQLRSCGGVVPTMRTASKATNQAVPYRVHDENMFRSVHLHRADPALHRISLIQW